MLTVLPEVAKEPCFALYGGTAINLFIRNMPRLSVDIDLIYVPVEERASSFANISAALERIKSHIETIITGARVVHRKDAGKLQISAHGTSDTFQLSPGNVRSGGGEGRLLWHLWS